MKMFVKNKCKIFFLLLELKLIEMVQKNYTINTVKQQLALTLEGVPDEEVNAFKIQLGTEVKKPVEQQRFLYMLQKLKAQTFILFLYEEQGYGMLFGDILLWK